MQPNSAPGKERGVSNIVAYIASAADHKGKEEDDYNLQIDPPCFNSSTSTPAASLGHHTRSYSLSDDTRVNPSSLNRYNTVSSSSRFTRVERNRARIGLNLVPGDQAFYVPLSPRTLVGAVEKTWNNGEQTNGLGDKNSNVVAQGDIEWTGSGREEHDSHLATNSVSSDIEAMGEVSR